MSKRIMLLLAADTLAVMITAVVLYNSFLVLLAVIAALQFVTVSIFIFSIRRSYVLKDARNQSIARPLLIYFAIVVFILVRDLPSGWTTTDSEGLAFLTFATAAYIVFKVWSGRRQAH